ncbi:unnamed protein product [marine sediment metagenome]|uniref:Right handed beta helix domain-containing protein n=1 Tax=marine sediment metagenome TaxID=412755 RepID=X1AVF9_9ZZZZ
MGGLQLGGNIALTPAEAQEIHAIAHIPKFPGETWYADVNAAAGGDGTEPDIAFQTIGEALAAASAGDAISVKAGIYTETGLDLNLDALQLWYETGTVLSPPSGTVLTLSGDYCRTRGNHRIVPAAGAIGVLLSGDSGIVEDATILTGATGLCITGSGAQVKNFAAGFQSAVAYDIQGIQARLRQCNTVGNGATVGYRISNGVDTGVLENCTSAGHATSGFYIGHWFPRLDDTELLQWCW